VPYAKHRETGEVLTIDAFGARIGRMRRRVYAWSKYLAPFIHNTAGFRLVMCTLTLDPQYGWQPGMVRYYMRACKRNLKHNLLGYAWTAEMQKRGAVHYHVLLVVRAGTDVPEPDTSGWWPYGSSRRETARTVYYIVKYLSKGRFIDDGKYHPTLPQGLRIFAVWIAPSFTNEPGYWQFTLEKLPGWLRELMVQSYQDFTAQRGVGGYDLSPPYDPEVKIHITTPWIFILQTT
jgi:hypothetical protein